MRISFSKFHGAGNDFILIDDREERLSIDAALVRSLCRRSFGVGADGVILVQNSALADYRMRIFNADGSEAEMCGNGVRCFFRYVAELGEGRRRISLETMERLLSVWAEGDEIAVEMGAVQNVTWNLEIDGNVCHVMDTGVPHLVLFLDEIGGSVLEELAPHLRSHSLFPKGVNVNLVQVGDGELLMRTWERGVEGETFACGTGACAAGVAASALMQWGALVPVRVASGDLLHIQVGEGLRQVIMRGPAVKVYEGGFSLGNRQTLQRGERLEFVK